MAASQSLDFVGEMTASFTGKVLPEFTFSTSVATPDRIELPLSVDVSSVASIADFLAAAVTLGLSILIRAE